MPSSHHPPDKTRRSCLCRIGRCELSLEAVWQSLPSTVSRQITLVAWRLVKKFTLVICNSPQRVYIFVAYNVAACGRSGG